EHDRPGELLNLAVESWVEFGLFQLFADTAGLIHLSDYRQCAYVPLRETAREIARDEGRHCALAMDNLRAALRSPEARARAQTVLPAWYAAGGNLFGRADHPS